MSTNHTTNYNLNQWLATDQVKRTEFNEDNTKIDAALKANADDIAALETAVENKGNCTVWTTSYVGNGQCGAAAPTSITFPKQPLYCIVSGSTGRMGFFQRGQTASTGIKIDFNEPCYWLSVTWSGNTLSWWGATVWEQLNDSGSTYFVLAFLDAEE